MLPLGVFVVCRTFSALGTQGMGQDALGYLALARGFPRYRLYGGYVYLLHPPIYAGLIWLVSRFLPLVTSGLVVTQGAAIAVFFLIKKYAELHGVSPAGKTAGLLYAAVLTLSIAWDNQVSRYSSLVAVMGAVLVGLEMYLRSKAGPEHRGRWMLAGILGSLLAFLTTDQAILLFPCVAVCFVCSRRWEKWRGVILLLCCMAASAAVWPMVRLVVCEGHATYPAGIDGMIEPVGQFKWRTAVQPNLLPNTAENNAKFMGVTPTLWPVRWKRIFGEPLRLSVRWQVGGRWVAGILAVMGVLRAKSWGVTRRRVWYAVDEPLVGLKLLLLFLLLDWPALVGLYPWYGLAFVLPGAVLVARGADGVVKSAGRFWVTPARAVAVMGIWAVVFCADWIAARPRGPFVLPDFPPMGGKFLYAKPVEYSGKGLGESLAGLVLGERCMAPVGLVDSLVFEGGNRVLALPFDPGFLAEQVREYRVQYLVVPEGLLEMHFGGALTRKYTSQQIGRWIDSHQGEYPLVAILRENGEAYRLYGVSAVRRTAAK